MTRGKLGYHFTFSYSYFDWYSFLFCYVDRLIIWLTYLIAFRSILERYCTPFAVLSEITTFYNANIVIRDYLKCPYIFIRINKMLANRLILKLQSKQNHRSRATSFCRQNIDINSYVNNWNRLRQSKDRVGNVKIQIFYNRFEMFCISIDYTDG